MNCSSCDSVLTQNSKFCTKCGAAQNTEQLLNSVEEISFGSESLEIEPVAGLVARIRSNKPVLISLGIVSVVMLIVAGAGLGSAGAFDWAFGEKYSKSDVTTAYNRGYSAGEDSGYSSGQSAGYNEGYSSGKSAGESTGYRNGCQHVFDTIFAATGYSDVVAWDSYYASVRGLSYYSSSMCD